MIKSLGSHLGGLQPTAPPESPKSTKSPEQIGIKLAYIVDPNQDGTREIWDQVGTAVVFDDGQIVLQLWALPLSGRVVLVDGEMPRVVDLAEAKEAQGTKTD